jgi:hypothetical protein
MFRHEAADNDLQEAFGAYCLDAVARRQRRRLIPKQKYVAIFEKRLLPVEASLDFRDEGVANACHADHFRETRTQTRREHDWRAMTGVSRSKKVSIPVIISVLTSAQGLSLWQDCFHRGAAGSMSAGARR